MFTFVIKPCIPKIKITSETSYYLIGLEFLFVYSFSIANHDSSPYTLLKASLRIVTVLMAFCFIFHFLFMSLVSLVKCVNHLIQKNTWCLETSQESIQNLRSFLSETNVKIMPNMETLYLVVSVDLFSQITGRYESSKLFQVLLFT